MKPTVEEWVAADEAWKQGDRTLLFELGARAKAAERAARIEEAQAIRGPLQPERQENGQTGASRGEQIATTILTILVILFFAAAVYYGPSDDPSCTKVSAVADSC